MVADISGNTITIIGTGISNITATQGGINNYTSGSTSVVLEVIESSPSNPVVINNEEGFKYFMLTTSKYMDLRNSIEITDNLISETPKVLTSSNLVRIERK